MERILVTGVSGFIGSRLAERMSERPGAEVCGVGRTPPHVPGRGNWRPVDLSRDDDALLDVAQAMSPTLVIHAAALADLGACEREPERASAVNVNGTRSVIDAAAAVGARLVHLSTDQVFDGTRGGYREDDEPSPLHHYGRTKLAAEKLVLNATSMRDAIVLRLPLVYGTSPTRTRSASELLLRQRERGERPRLFIDEFRTPILVDDITSTVAELAFTDEIEWPRILHLAGPERVSRYDFGVTLAEIFEFDSNWIEPARQRDAKLKTPRPADLSLDTTRVRDLLQARPRGVRAGLEAWRRELLSTERD